MFGRILSQSKPMLATRSNIGLSFGQQQRQHIRNIATPTLPLAGLEEFRDPVSRTQRMNEMVGRKWSVKELRRKSYDDLHKLWLVLYKENNMLLTELQLSRRRQLNFPQPERFDKVKKSMGAIKHVLGERKVAAIKAGNERGRLRREAVMKQDEEDFIEDEEEPEKIDESTTPKNSD